jgi:hypothetical protein
MKFRSLLLLTCMVVVPLTAMFSHRIPGGLRGIPGRLEHSVPRSFWEPVKAWLGGSTASPGAARNHPDEPLRPVSDGMSVLRDGPAAGAAGSQESSREIDALRARLSQVGAVGVECRPLPGSTGDHLAMCRLPVDAAGHLHRVFQTTGPDAPTAQRRLVVDVEAWLQRTASRTSP